MRQKHSKTIILSASFIIVLLSSFLCIGKNTQAKPYSMATPENPYKISIIGDSISFEPSYATIIGENPNINVTTYAIGATQVAGKDNAESFVNRTKNTIFNADLIMIMGGTNDYCGIEAFCNPLGDIGSTDIDTFCGAYNVMISRIKRNNPNSRIVLITPIKRAGTKTPNIYGYDLTQYVTAVQMIAAKNNVNCIDLFNNKDCDFITSHFLFNGNDMYFNSKNESSLWKSNGYTVDGLHPTIEGHKVIADTIMKYIPSY